MKRLLSGAILLNLLLFSGSFSQNFTCSIRNQQVSGANFLYDVYILRTGGTPLYLGNADFVLTFNSGNFTSPLVQKVAGSSDLNGFYSVGTSLVSGNRAVVNVLPPTPLDQDEFDSKVQSVSNSGYGTRVCTVRITNITNTSGTAGLQWRSVNPNKTQVFNFNSSDPWNQTEVTSNGTYTNPSDQSLPVAMTSINASASREQGVVVEWRVESETDCAGFHILRSVESDGAYGQITGEANMIAGRGNASDAKDYQFVDRNVENGKVYWYKIVEVSTKGKRETYGPISVTALSPVPTEFGFSECYPNPFNPETTVDYKTAEDGNVSVIVYNLMGKQIRTLITGSKPAGYYKALWNGRDDRGETVPTGIYFIRMQTTDFSKVRKVMMMK